MKKQIESMEDLCNYFYADEPAMLNKRIYKGTDCGASISVQIAPEYPNDPAPTPYYEEPPWIHNGDPAWQHLTMDAPLLAFTIQTIVEGSDATVDSLPFVLPVETSAVNEWIEDMESEAAMLWLEANEYGEEV